MKTFMTLLMFSFLIAGTLSAADRQITGKVTSESGHNLVGVTVIVKGTAIGTYTKSDGTYKISVPPGSNTLIFRYVGMITKEVQLGTDNVLNIILMEDKVQMDEVVVTAIGLERQKKSLGYSIQEVGGGTISGAKTTNVVDALSGNVAGVKINRSAGTPGASSFINIRGQSSITGSNQPLFVVDGIPVDNSMEYTGNPDNGRNNWLDNVAYSNRAIDLNNDDIESITVLKGPAATALYGMQASAGAIVITTKKGTSAVGEKININYTFGYTAEEVNKLPELQDYWAQGVDDPINLWWDPDNADKYVPLGTNFPSMSWGGPIKDLRYSTTEKNKFSPNGMALTTAGAADDSGIPVGPFDNTGNFFQTGQKYSNSISMAGGSDLGSFFFSLSDSREAGVVPNSEFNRTTVKLSGEAKISTRMKASGSVNYITSGGRRIQQGSNVSGVMLGLMRTPPNFDNSNGHGADGWDNVDAYKFEDGTQRSFRGGGGYDNPFWTANMNRLDDNVDRIIGNVKLDYYVASWLNIMYRFGGDVYTDTRKNIFGTHSNQFPAGQVDNHDITNQDYNSDLILTFSHQITDDLSGRLLIGHNMFSTESSELYVQGDGLIIPEFYHLSNTTSRIVRESVNRKRTAALYTDLSFDYKDWLFFSGTLRNEWSTSLPEENNSFMYGSGEISFIFTQALKDMFADGPLSFGQLRLNYAIVGKDAPIYSTRQVFIPGTYADGWTNGISFPYNGQVGYAMGDVLANKDLKPERTSSFEGAINLNFFDDLFSIDVTYYSSIHEDQIFSVPIAYSSGYWRQIMNAGKLTNKGVEIMFKATPVNSDIKWDIALNWATNENMVEELAPGVDNIFLGGFEGSSIRAVAGNPYGSIFGFGWLRDDAGNIVIDDDPESGNYGFPILDPEEKRLGDPNPDWTLGFRNTFTWENLSLSVLFDIKQGGQMWNGTKGALFFFGTHKETDVRSTTEDGTVIRSVKKVFDGVGGHYDANGDLVTSGPNTTEADVDFWWLSWGNGNGFFGSNTEDFIEDAGWVRLREVSLAYQLPQTIVEMLPFSQVTVVLTGRNLWLSTDYTGIDPETNLMGAFNAQGIDYFNMPGIRSYNFSLSVKF